MSVINYNIQYYYNFKMKHFLVKQIYTSTYVFFALICYYKLYKKKEI